MNSLAQSSRFSNFVRVTQLTWLWIVLLSILLFLARLAFIAQHGGVSFDDASLWDTLYWGARLDWRTAATLCLLFYGLTQCMMLLWHQQANQVMRYYRHALLLILWVVCCLSVVNHFYYLNFQNHIDVFIFDFLDADNAQAVLHTLWLDYPVLQVLFLLALLFSASLYLLTYIHKQSDRYMWQVKSSLLRVLYIVLSIVLLLVSARGSVGTFPLMLSEISIAGDVFLSRAVANGPMAFADAWTAWKNMQDISPVSQEHMKKAYQTWFGKPYQGQQHILLADDVLSSQIKINKDESRANQGRIKGDSPDVVMVQMESWGGQIAGLQGEDNPILGEFAQHQEQDYWFPRFLSSTKGTLGSIEKLLANTGAGNMARGRYRHTPFSAAPAKIFQKLGYHTVFITSGTGSWSNIEQFVAHQGFDEMLDVEDIRLHIKDAQHDGSWGVFDGFTFDYVLQYLQEKHEKPVFVYVLTITNHSPYTTPEHTNLPSIHVPKHLQYKVFGHDLDKASTVMKTYQYASNALGELMTSIKGSALAEHTIVAATGDHYMRDLFNYYLEPDDILYQYQVPFYLYVPERLRQGIRYDARRIGSHKDIFPTIFKRIVAQDILLTGRDMLQDTQDDALGIGLSEELIISADGAVLKGGKFPVYYQWQGDVLQPGLSNPALVLLNEKHQAYSTLLRWQTLQDIQRSAQD